LTGDAAPIAAKREWGLLEMRSRVYRSAVAAIGGLLCSVALPSAASATDFSINTNVVCGDAWGINPPGYLDAFA